MPKSASSKIPKPWAGDGNSTEAVAVHLKFGTFWKHETTGLWWSRDRSRHGGSKWKVFTEGADGLHWFKDADDFGDFIVGKHKSELGKFIPWNDLGKQ
jgi:hypothetical protein